MGLHDVATLLTPIEVPHRPSRTSPQPNKTRQLPQVDHLFDIAVYGDPYFYVLHMYAYKNIWNGISNGKYKLSLNVSISCIDISGLLGDIFKILHMNTLAYCIMSRYCSIISIFAKTSLKS